MSGPGPGKYEWGQRVRAAADLFNDGSFPDQPVDALLVRAGDAGEIVQSAPMSKRIPRSISSSSANIGSSAVSKRKSPRFNQPAQSIVSHCPSNRTDKGAP